MLKSKLSFHKSLLVRIIIFSIIFIVESGFLGFFIIPSQLLYKYYFYIYPNLGKILLFAFMAYILINRDKIIKIKVPTFNKIDIVSIFLSLVLIPIFIYLAKQLILSEDNLFYSPQLILTHLIFISIPTFLILGCFGISYTFEFFKQNIKTILVCLGLSILFELSIFFVWNLWPYLSSIVLHVIYFMFSYTTKPLSIVPPRGLFIRNFVVIIEESCSGIDSIYLFTALYFLVSIFDWNKLSHFKVFIYYFPLLTGLFIVNCLRVYILIWIGLLTSPEIMINLFHTYLGMILFLIYFLLFMKYIYPDLLTKGFKHGFN